jgi:hypothetical protein
MVNTKTIGTGYLDRSDRNMPVEYAEMMGEMFGENSGKASEYLTKLVKLDMGRQFTNSTENKVLPVRNNICNVKNLVKVCSMYGENSFDALKTIYDVVIAGSPSGKLVSRLKFGPLQFEVEDLLEDGGDLTIKGLETLASKRFFKNRMMRPGLKYSAPNDKPFSGHHLSNHQYEGR